MQNWYCLIHFPDGTDGVRLVPGPAPIYGEAIRIAGEPGRWNVVELTARVPTGVNYAAEIWVEPREPR